METEKKDTRSPALPPEPSSGRKAGPALQRHLAFQIILLCTWVLVWAVLQRLMEAQGLGQRPQLLALLLGGCALLGSAFLFLRQALLDILSSLRFAVLQLVLLLASLGLASLGAFPGFAGGAPGGLAILAQFLLLAATSGLVAWKRRSAHPSRWGFTLVHASLVLLLAGGLWNLFSGLRGYRELRPGDTVDAFRLVTAGRLGDQPLPLPGYRLRLDGCQPLEAPPLYRLYAYLEPDGKGGFESRPLALAPSLGLRQSLPGGLQLEVRELIQDAEDRGRWVERAGGPPNPALRVALELGLDESPQAVLLGRGPEARLDEPLGRFSAILGERWSPELLQGLGPRPPRSEKLVLDLEGRRHSRELKAGDAWEQSGLGFKVLGIYPDFAIRKDAQGDPQPFSASTRPLDPWVQLEMARQENGLRRVCKVLLCARRPEVTDRLNAPNLPPGVRLRYIREGEDPQSRFAVFTLQDMKARLVQDGRVEREEPLVPGRPFVLARGLALRPLEVLQRADYEPVFQSAGNGGGRPVAKVVVRDAAGREEGRWLEAAGPDGEPVGGRFLDGRLGLVYRLKDQDPRDLYATLTLLDAQGGIAAQGRLSLAEAFRHQGLAFHLASPRRVEGEAVALILAAEPGRPLQQAACVMLCLGMAWMFLLKPWLKRREAASERP